MSAHGGVARAKEGEGIHARTHAVGARISAGVQVGAGVGVGVDAEQRVDVGMWAVGVRTCVQRQQGEQDALMRLRSSSSILDL